ncbi:MAG: hypothetical protein JW943_10525 [Deltaproteobacteria bacterium]|nr:hypothetical protein [Deltaproteobacteria bacterium]
MNTLCFKTLLQSDVIFSERSATTGGHSTLDYIPGSAILGLCASQLYSELGKDAFKVFHSGHARFGCAYPLDELNHPMMPIPIAWHTEKGKSANKEQKLETASIFNMLFTTEEREKELQIQQPKQIREGYFSLNGSYVKPLSSYRLKTAIDRDKGGRPKEEQFFGYESLDKGSAFYFTIEFDDNVDESIQEKIRNMLTEKPRRIGKSRTAEYGAVTFSVLKGLPVKNAPALNGNYLTVYCLSDIALRDEQTGVPTLIPESHHFHLDKVMGPCDFLPEKSFIRTRTYSPYNRTWQTHDLERNVICKGSILSFFAKQDAIKMNLIALQEEIECGVGCYRQDGLGKVLINPPFLADWQFRPDDTQSPLLELNTMPQADDPLDNSLISWLTANHAFSELDEKAGNKVEEWIVPLISGVKKLKTKAPGKSQWSQLRTIAIQSASISDFKQLLFDSDKALCTRGVTRKKWDERSFYQPAGQKISFSDFIKDYVLIEGSSQTDQVYYTRQLVYRLGSRLQHVMNQEGL